MRATFVLCALLLLGSSVQAQAQKREPKYCGKPLAKWLEILQNGESATIQREAAQAISSFGPEAAPAVPALMKMLDDRSPEYRELVLDILYKIGPAAKSAVPELVKRLKELRALKPLKDEELQHSNEVSHFIRVLGSIGPDAKEAVPLVECALNDSDCWDARHAILTLCKIGPPAKEAIPSIRRAVMKEVVESEKRETTYYQKWSFPELNSNFPGLDVQDYAGPFGDYRNHLHQLGPDVLPVLLEILDRKSLPYQRTAFREIAKLHDFGKAAAPKVATFLKSEKPLVRYYASVVLWGIEKNKSVVPVLADLLSNNDSDLVKNAAMTLVEIGADSKGALPQLQAALKSRKAEEQRRFSDNSVEKTLEAAIEKIETEPKK